MTNTKTVEDWREEELVMVSMIEHYSYCPRQCALIHLENVFDENVYTTRGHIVHEHVDEPSSEIIDGIRIERALPIWSDQLGLIGKADVVEFHNGVPYPVEYKSGKKKGRIHEELQLCGQILCLEEMFNCSIAKGAVFYFASKKRREIIITDEHRIRTIQIVREVRDMLLSQQLPPAHFDRRCQNCSLIDSCLPEIIGPTGQQNIVKQLSTMFNSAKEDSI
jgi:CRISPR-associated exonuclease Cas4